MAVALYTGQRQGDVLAMEKGHVRRAEGGRHEIHVVQAKTGTAVWITMHRNLVAALEEMRASQAAATTPRLSRRLLVNSHGGEWTTDGFKASWAPEMGQREFRYFRRHRLVFHGLRKSAVVFLLEAGCTTAEVAAITGQSMQMVEHEAGEPAEVGARRDPQVGGRRRTNEEHRRGELVKRGTESCKTVSPQSQPEY